MTMLAFWYVALVAIVAKQAFSVPSGRRSQVQVATAEDAGGPCSSTAGHNNPNRVVKSFAPDIFKVSDSVQ